MSSAAPSRPFSKIGIVGLGLMGGSLARALRRLPETPSVVALSNDAVELKKALDLGIVDRTENDPGAFLEGLDLVVYCTPLNATLALLSHHEGLLGPTTAITDVVSLKVPVVEQAQALGLQGRFVGSHPLCGGEGSGFDASREDLYSGSKVWVVPGEADSTIVGFIEDFWRSLGSKAVSIEAAAHDTLMAVVSHLPQLTANALALTLEDLEVFRTDLGPGGTDMTRLAGSSADVWTDLFEHAPAALNDALVTFEGRLAEIRTLVEAGKGEDLRDLMQKTRAWSKGDG